MSISANIINCCADNDGIQTITAKPVLILKKLFKPINVRWLSKC